MTDEPREPREALGPPPVEPLSDVSWARVERGLWKRLDAGAPDERREPPRRRLVAWITVPVVAAAAVLAIVLAARGDAGEVGDEDPIASPTPSIEPSRVVAGASPSSVSYGDAHIELAAQSAIVMDREGNAPSVLLERGVATFAVAPRDARPPFVVRAGDTVVRVVGTQFVVARDGEQVAVAVEHGIVDVQFHGRLQRVSAGRRWSSTRPEVVAMAPAVEPEVVDPEIVEPEIVEPEVVEPEVVPPPARPTRPDKPTTKPTIADTERATYERLATIEARDPTAAMTGYLALSRGNTRWSAVALYAAARLAADRHDPRATTFLTIYLRRFPAGANAPDARRLLDRIKGEPK